MIAKSNLFSSAVRHARMSTGHSIASMAIAMNVSPSHLIDVENGDKEISLAFVFRIKSFFEENKMKHDSIWQLAQLSNGYVPIALLSESHQMLVANIAKINFSANELIYMNECIDLIKSKRVAV